MKKSIILAAAALVASASPMQALDVETMVVTLKDGTTLSYNVEDIQQLEFNIEHIEEAFTVTPADGQKVIYSTIPSMLRVKAVATGDPTHFAFGTVESATAEGLVDGEYGVWLTVSSAKLYNGEFNLAESSDSYSLKLAKYTDGQAEVLEKVTEGTLLTKLNSKNRKVTLELDATFDDGTRVTASYEGIPTDVESVAGMIPAKQYGNELYYTDINGTEIHTDIESLKVSRSSFSGKTTYTFNLSDNVNMSDYEARLVLTSDFQDSLEKGVEHVLEMANTPGWEFRLGNIQLYCTPKDDSSYMYMNQADNGTMKITINEDGTYEFFVDIINSYSNYMGTHTDPQHVILHYAGK